MLREHDTLTFKNKQTGKPETIHQYHVEILDWGFHFLVATELEAYKAAYQFRHNQYGTQVEFSPNTGMWLVTVYNEFA